MKINVETKENGVTIFLIGNFDKPLSKDLLFETIEKNPSKNLVLDLSELDFGSSYLASCLIQLYREQISFSIKNVSPTIKELFSITGVDKIITIYE